MLFRKQRVHMCAEPVTNAVEGYRTANGSVYGEIDRVAYVCRAHVERGHDYMTGLTPFTALMVGTAGVDFTARCGEVTDWAEPGLEVEACGCGGEGCDACQGTYVVVVPGQSVSDGEDDERQEDDVPPAAVQI